MQLTAEQLDAMIRPMPRAKYEVDHAFPYVEKALESYAEGCGLDLIPDFQRGHVWTEAQKIAWLEAVYRGNIPAVGMTIQFNSPSWETRGDSDIPDTTVCIDGLQRLTAIREFVAGKLPVFGMYINEFDGTSYDARRYRFRAAVHTFKTRRDLLQYYLDLNAGGTPHSAEELERVGKLLEASK